MLAELVDHVIGIDPDKDWITAAFDGGQRRPGVIESARFSADSDGYARCDRVGRRDTPTPGESSLGDRRLSQLRSWPDRRACASR